MDEAGALKAVRSFDSKQHFGGSFVTMVADIESPPTGDFDLLGDVKSTSGG
jgi:hypothetical protein